MCDSSNSRSYNYNLRSPGMCFVESLKLLTLQIIKLQLTIHHKMIINRLREATTNLNLTTYSRTTLSTKSLYDTLSITMLCHDAECQYAECRSDCQEDLIMNLVLYDRQILIYTSVCCTHNTSLSLEPQRSIKESRIDIYRLTRQQIIDFLVLLY
jgi:hypothetical protein